MTTTENGTAYYKYMAIYVDYFLHIAKYAQEDMLKLNQVYRLKEGVGPPNRYLGANVDKVQLEDERTFWSMTCVEYLCGDIKNVDSILEGKNAALEFFRDGHCLYPSSYRPELEVTNELDEEFTNRFQYLIGVLSWLMEIGRVYIMTEVSCLS